ncbi:outer membrane esterase [Salmonella enterica subsp. enterica serovar Sanjuan]|uniref:Outer membrane esterase n=1 Tax=Salmonella enterica subsp. enterica serovar Sanjuan TaxID=1160765 RepID=A0A447NZ08_SALET|nr:outer membrane esterase [Salmonella enterica subsp. enterica serovar Sanjuan]
MTQKRTLLKYGILSLALAVPLSACAFDSLTVIGDSLSDTGNNGRWTWDSGQNKLYDEQLAERYGLELSPSSNGGSNYAAGGATATPELNPQDNTADQVRQWLAKTGGKSRPQRFVYSLGRRKRSGGGHRATCHGTANSR